MDVSLKELLPLMVWPLVASLTLPWLLVYLGLHIVQRGVIFVDLALAQMAALGTCFGLLVGYDVHDWQDFAISMGFTFAGAAILTFTRTRDRRVPQEALIGIIYVVAAAATILALSHTAGGNEELQRSLVGELLVVPPAEIVKTLVLFVVVGAAHFAFRKKFLGISADADAVAAAGVNVRWWDFLFYMLFGLVVTSFVHIGGVLLVFSYLVVPAVCATYLAESIRARFFVGWGIATACSVGSLLLSARKNLPIGATTVCVLGGFLIMLLVIKRFLPQPARQPTPPAAPA